MQSAFKDGARLLASRGPTPDGRVLLLRYLKKKANRKWYMSNLIIFLRLNLFVKIDLYEWLHIPIYQPAQIATQKTLFDTG